MICTVGMQRPDGTRTKTMGHYANPGVAMDMEQALHPDCVVNSAVAHKADATPSGRSCDELGVCQSVTKTCPSHTICARKNTPFYFAPGLINGGSTDLQADASGWVFETTWTDWAGAVAVLVILGAICGWLV